MKKPILGKQTFLKENTERLKSFEKFMLEGKGTSAEEKPLYTGRYFVIPKDRETEKNNTRRLLESEAGLRIASLSDFTLTDFNEDLIEDADALYYPHLGISLVGASEEQVQLLESRSHTSDFILEPEKIVYVPDDVPAPLNVPSTWGIFATRTAASSFTGRDIKIAILDTGFDRFHPDFKGRQVVSSSFVPGEAVDDLHGHGTHCIGTACGHTNFQGQRYGVANKSTIYAGKVLNNSGSGAQAWILSGMNWAVQEGCKVISMSLGSKVYPGQGYDLAYERAASYVVSRGAVVLAAAGNDSHRSHGIYAPVGSPANCPSVLAVAAIDRNLNIADFSCRALNPNQLVDIAGPGVEVYSSWPMPTRYRTISGTSMATPHVAGILALLFEQYPQANPQFIVTKLLQLTQPLQQLNIDVGHGLAIAP